MNGVFKWLFEITAKTTTIIAWSFTHPILALKFVCKSEALRPYLSAFVLTAIAVTACLRYGINQYHSLVFVFTCAVGMFLLLSTIFKCLRNGEELYGRAPIRKETKIFESIFLPFVIMLPVALYMAHRFPAPMARVLPPMDETTFEWVKPVMNFIGQFPIIFPVTIIAVIIIIAWSILNYRGYDKK